MNAFAGIRPKGVETRPLSFFPWRLQWELSVFQWGSNPHNPSPRQFLPWLHFHCSSYYLDVNVK